MIYGREDPPTGSVIPTTTDETHGDGYWQSEGALPSSVDDGLYGRPPFEFDLPGPDVAVGYNDLDEPQPAILLIPVHRPRTVPQPVPAYPPAATQPPQPWLAERWRRWLGRTEVIALAAIVLLALVIRLYNLGGFPDTLNPDEADTSQDAMRILNGMPRENGFFGVDWTQQPAHAIYLMAAFLRVFGINITAIRLPAVLYSTLALIPFFLLLRRQFRPIPALLATFLLATNLWYLNFSRSGWNNIFICFYLLMAMLFLLAGFDALKHTNRPAWWKWFCFGAVGFFCAAGLYGYTSGRTILVTILAFFPIALWLHRRRWPELVFGYVLIGLVTILLFLPQGLYIARNWTFFNQRTGVVFLLNKPEFKADPVGTMRDQIVKNVVGFWSGRNNHMARYTPDSEPLFDRATSTLVLVGMGLSLGLARLRRRPETWLWWAMFLVPWAITQLITTNTPDGARGIGWMPTLLFFAAASFEGLLLLHDRLGQRAQWLQSAAVMIALLIGLYNVNHYVTWQQQSMTREQRQPYIELGEFAKWSGDVIARAREKGGSFPVSEWRITNPQGSVAIQTETNNPPTTANNSRPATPAFNPPSTPQDQWPRLVTTIGPGTGAERLQQPRAVAVDQAGNVYVLDSDSQQQRVRKYDPQGTFLTSWGGPGGPEEDGKFQSAWAISVNSSGEVLVLDEATYWVHVFDIEGTFVRKWGGPAAKLYHPRAMSVVGDNVYIADTGGARIVVYGGDGTLRGEMGGKNSGLPLADQVMEPSGVTAGPQGNILVADAPAGLIRNYTTDGQPTGTWPFGKADASDGPRLVAAPDGSIYATLPAQCMFVHFDTDGNLLDKGGGCDAKDYLGKPGGIAVGADGKLYVTDLDTQTVRVYVP